MYNGKYDFCGWATKNDLRCADGRVIRHGAFKVNDGKKVPLVYNHEHNNIGNVLGHAILENRNEGVYAYGLFNNTLAGQEAKEAVIHGDINAMSIWANDLEQDGADVLHGIIREVSLVLAGANPGAFVESVMIHGVSMDESDTEGLFFTGDTLELAHSDIEVKDKEDKDMEGDTKSDEQQTSSDKTVGDIYEAMTDEQKKAVAIISTQLLEDALKSAEDADDEENNEEDEDQEGTEMKHNMFDSQDTGAQDNYISHDAFTKIIADAKRCGSLREAVENSIESGVLAHAIDTIGMDTAKGSQTYGFNDPSMLFPDYKTLTNTPEFIKRETSWVNDVMGKVHHTPFSRIKSVYANITEDEARAKGYIKGSQKKTEVFSTLKRTTDPQTVYKLQKMDRDDIADITDFDVVAWIKAEMRMMLEEEIARAILIGDGRQSDAEDKIQEAHVRPVVNDVPLFNTKVTVSATTSEDDAAVAKKIINAVIKSRKNYKGSGNPTFYTTEDVLTDMLLLEDGIGHKLYKSEAELATALRVAKIVTVEPMEGQVIDTKELVGTIVNLVDYNIGADKGGSINLFDDFDLNYNKYEYLIETRISGALIKPYSAITVLLDKQ